MPADHLATLLTMMDHGEVRIRFPRPYAINIVSLSSWTKRSPWHEQSTDDLESTTTHRPPTCGSERRQTTAQATLLLKLQCRHRHWPASFVKHLPLATSAKGRFMNPAQFRERSEFRKGALYIQLDALEREGATPSPRFSGSPDETRLPRLFCAAHDGLALKDGPQIRALQGVSA